MFRRKGLALVTACAVLACGELVRAETPSTSLFPTAPAAGQMIQPVLLDDTTQPVKPPVAPVASAPAPADGTMTPFMASLGPVGRGLSNAGITVTGYVEGSWTYDARPQAGNFIAGRLFDSKNESLQFDAVELNVSRTVDYTKKTVDFGFVLENMYGWDTAFFHSNGLTIYGPAHTASPFPGTGGTLAIHPKAQYDLTQAYGTLMLPFGNGLGIQFGKWDTLMGYEAIDTNTTPFFSRSFIFQEEPFTHTGALLIYNFLNADHKDTLVATAGFSRGWDQATRDINGNIDYTGQVKYVTADQKTTLQFTGITGNEEASNSTQDGWRTVLDFVGKYQYSDNLLLGVNGMYAWENQASEGGSGGGIGQWYAVAAYAQYKQSDYLTFNVRGEWFDDQDGAAPTQYLTSTFNPSTGKFVGIPNQYYEATFGVSVTPLPNNVVLKGLTIRPEFRWDYSDHAAWNAATQHDQWTASIDAYFSF